MTNRATGLACVRCDKPIVRVKGSPGGGPLEVGAYDDAVVHDIHGGYGSCFDSHTLIVGVCDECLAMLLSRGQIVEREYE